MTEHATQYPKGFVMDAEWEASEHNMQIERFDKRLQQKIATDYLNVQNRLIWFIRDQRVFIVGGMATCSYIIQTELVELDREKEWAHFKTYVRDVLGNEATMYGSESAKDFPDYIEKASTKSLGRALLLLGYGTQVSGDIDDGSRPVDSPQARKGSSNVRAIRPQTQAEMVPIGKVRYALKGGGYTTPEDQNAFLTSHKFVITDEYTQEVYERIVLALRDGVPA